MSVIHLNNGTGSNSKGNVMKCIRTNIDSIVCHLPSSRNTKTQYNYILQLTITIDVHKSSYVHDSLSKKKSEKRFLSCDCIWFGDNNKIVLGEYVRLFAMTTLRCKKSEGYLDQKKHANHRVRKPPNV